MEFLTARDIAEQLKISYQTALDFIKYSRVRYIRVGKQYRVKKEDFESFINEADYLEVDLSGVDTILSRR